MFHDESHTSLDAPPPNKGLPASGDLLPLASLIRLFTPISPPRLRIAKTCRTRSKLDQKDSTRVAIAAGSSRVEYWPDIGRVASATGADTNALPNQENQEGVGGLQAPAGEA